MWKRLAAIALSTTSLRGCEIYYPPETPDQAVSSIFRVLSENCAAANAEDVDKYMNTFDPDCPDLRLRRRSFQRMCEIADLDSRIVRMNILELNSRQAQVLYITRTEKRDGPAFLEDNLIATQHVTLRRTDRWRVYSVVPLQEGYFRLAK